MSKPDSSAYLILLALLLPGLILFWAFAYDRQLQVFIILAMACVYVLWGVLFHAQQKEFYLKVLLEYASIALLACAVVISLLVFI